MGLGLVVQMHCILFSKALRLFVAHIMVKARLSRTLPPGRLCRPLKHRFFNAQGALPLLRRWVPGTLVQRRINSFSTCAVCLLSDLNLRHQ